MTTPLRVLILEDRPADAELMMHELRRAGFEPDWQRVDTEDDFCDCLDQAWDLILADYSLPQWNAPNALNALHERGLDIPFIMISGEIGDDAAIECIKQGAADYLLKDRMARLGPAVVRALEDRRLRTEKHIIDVALRESEERHRLLFDNASLGIGYFTLGGQLVVFNRQAGAYMGGEPEDFAGQTLVQLYGQQAAALVLERIELAARSQSNQTYEDFAPLPGGDKWFLSTYSKIADATDQVVGVQIISNDITDRKRAEEAQRNSEQEYRLLFDTMLDGFALHEIILDADGTPSDYRFLDVNPAFEHLTGLKASELIGKTVMEVLPDTEAFWLKTYGDVVLTGQSTRFESYSRAIGKHFEVVAFRPRQDQFATIIADITERKQAEEREKHLSSVLRAIRNVNQLIVTEKDPERLLQGACDNLTATRGYQTAWIAQVDQSGAFVKMATAGLDVATLSLEQRQQWGKWVYCAQQALAQPNPQNIADPSATCGDCPLVPTDKNLGATSVRLEHERQVFGVLTVSGPSEVLDNDEELGLLQEIAGDIAFALHNIDVEQKRRQAEIALRESEQLARSTLDGLTAHIAILDADGTILAVNSSWRAFAADNGGVVPHLGEGANYLAVCDHAVGPFSEGAAEFAAAIRAVLAGELAQFELEYPCHSPDEQRWFAARITPFPGEGPVRAVIAHENITQAKQAELKLAAERTLLRTLIDALPDRVYVKDVESRFTIKNAYDARQMGAASSEETVGKTDFDYYPLELAEQYFADDQAVLRSGQPLVNQEERIISADGTEGWILTSKVPLRDEQGIVIGLVGIGRDITPLKRAQAAEHDQRLVAEGLRDTAAALISAVELDTVMDTILESVARAVPHDAANIMLLQQDSVQTVAWRGYRRQVPSEAFLQEHRFSLEKPHLHKMFETGLPILIADTTLFPGWEARPETAWIRSHVAAPIRSHGQVSGFLNLDSGTPGFFTEDHAQHLQAFADQASVAIERANLYEEIRRRAAQMEQRVIERTEQLNHAKERTEAILNSSSDVVILCRADGSIEQVNPAFDLTFSRESDECVGQPISTLAVPDHISTLEQTFTTAVNTRQPQRLGVTVSDSQGKTFDADVVLSPIVESEGALLGIVCSLRDVTPHKQMEAQLRQMLEHEMEVGELKSRYVSMAAHDLRNPLAVILSRLDLLQRYGDRLTPEETDENYAQIRVSIRVMVDILDDILTFGRVEGNKVTFSPAPMDLIDFCNTLIAEVDQSVAGSHTIDFSSEGDCRLVNADPKLLRYMLSNLLSNALKYSPEESQAFFSVECGDDQVVFCVQDRGIGIPEMDQTRLFGPFQRAANVGSIPGTGLGLAIVKRSVDLHGGTITFESEEGRGTTFTITLPR